MVHNCLLPSFQYGEQEVPDCSCSMTGGKNVNFGSNKAQKKEVWTHRNEPLLATDQIKQEVIKDCVSSPKEEAKSWHTIC